METKDKKRNFEHFSREVETWWCGVILKLYWRTDGLPISGVFCLQGKVSFLHLLHNLLKTAHQKTLQDRQVWNNTWLKPCWLLKWLVSCCSSSKSCGQSIGQTSALLAFEDVVEEEEVEVEGGRWCSTGRYFSTAECASPVGRDLKFCKGTF